MDLEKEISVENEQNIANTFTQVLVKGFSVGLNVAILFMYFSLLVIQLIGCVLVGLKLGGVIAISWQLVTIPFMITAFSIFAVIVIYTVNEYITNRSGVKN